MVAVSKTIYTPSGWTIRHYEDGTVLIRDGDDEQATLPADAVEAIAELNQ